MRTYTFTIPGHPIPKARPRTGRNREGKPIAYMPKAYVEYKKHVAEIARKHIPFPMECVRLSITAYLCVNKSDGQPSGRKADIEGIFGSIADAIEGIAYERDWSVFTIGESPYRFIPYGQEERVEVVVEERNIQDYYEFPSEAR